MAESPIAKLFASLGFKVDRTGLKAFENDLKSVKKKIDSKEGISGATDRTRKKQSALFKEIKSNYSKVRPSLEQMRKDLRRLDGAMFQNRISAEEYGEARKRVTQQISKIETAAYNKNKQQLLRVEKMFDKRNFQLKELRTNASYVNRQYRAGNITLEERRRILEGIYREYRRIQSAQTATAGAGRTGQARTGPYAGGADPRQKGTHGIISALHSDVGLGALAGGFAAAQSVMAYQSFIAMEQGLTAATGVEQAGKEMEYLMNLSDRMGVFVGDLGKSFTGLAAAAKGTSVEGQGVRDIFEGVSAQARVLNLSAADTQGVFTAVTQIMNKGTVMAEELKNQLGERLPGSMQAAARAAHQLGITQDATTQSLFKAMEEGKLASEEFLPVFAAELLKTAEAGGALEAAVNSTGAAIGRFRTNLYKANAVFNESGFDRNIRILINVFSEFFKTSEGLFKFLGDSSQVLIYPLRALGEALGFMGRKVSEFVDESEGNIEKLQLWVGLFASLWKWGRKLLVFFVALPALISGVTKYLEEGNLSWEEWVITLGSAAAVLLTVLTRLRGIKNLIKGGVAAGGAAGGAAAAGGGAARTGLTSGALAGAGLAVGSTALAGFAVGALVTDAINNPMVDTGIGVGQRMKDMNLGGDEPSFMDKLSRIPGDLAKGWDMLTGAEKPDIQPIESTKRGFNHFDSWLNRAPTQNNFTATFNITGNNATEISDEVIRVINEQLIRPASASDPVTEK